MCLNIMMNESGIKNDHLGKNVLVQEIYKEVRYNNRQII